VNIETLFNVSNLKRFHFPGTLLWGVNARDKIADLTTGASSVGLFVDIFFHNDPFVGALRQQLENRLAFIHVCNGMPKAQPLQKLANQSPPPDIVLSIGGGSTVDAAKAAICQWIYGDFDGVGMGSRRGVSPTANSKRPLLIGVPTTAGTGADASRYYVTYDETTHAKVHGKSWRLIADWIVLDPAFLRQSPPSLLVSSAFDAFIHFFESFICRQERSRFGDMLSLDGICAILGALNRIVHEDSRSDQDFLDLQFSAAVGGIAISNIRTGNIHEAAGALLELSSLTHPETLMVFLRPAYLQYKEAIADRELPLLRRLKAELPELGLSDFGSVIDWWNRTFDVVGLTRQIRDKMGSISASPEALRAHIFHRVRDDRVWCEKESPLPLDDDKVSSFVDQSLIKFGI
jgi:alcohol dehydrogenase class IV